MTRARALEKALAKINEDYGDGTIGRGNFLPITRFSSGSIALDIEIGGGWPRGRILHLWGKESAGKSLLALHAMKQVQNTCVCGAPMVNGNCSVKCEISEPLEVVLLDYERTDDPVWDRKIGVDTGRVLTAIPQSAEDGVGICERFLNLHEQGAFPPGLIVIDSVAAMAPERELEKSVSERQPMTLPAIMASACRRFVSHLKARPFGQAHPTTILLLNQTRTVVNMQNPTVAPRQEPPGGRAIRFFTSISLSLTYTSFWGANGKKEPFIGQTTQFLVDKNKTYPQRKKGEFSFYTSSELAGQMQENETVIDYAIAYGLIDRSGSWFQYGDVKAQGRDTLLAKIVEVGALSDLKTKLVATAAHALSPVSLEVEE